MTKILTTAALAAVLIAPLGLSASIHPAAAAEHPQATPAAPAGSPNRCDSITDPVKKQECMKQQGGSAGK